MFLACSLFSLFSLQVDRHRGTGHGLYQPTSRASIAAARAGLVRGRGVFGRERQTTSAGAGDGESGAGRPMWSAEGEKICVLRPDSYHGDGH